MVGNMKKALFIYNPWSGDRSIPQKLDLIIERFQNNNTLLEVVRIGENSDLIINDLIKTNNYCSLIVSGGDGTVNYIVNKIMKNNLSVPLAIFPSGTCNDAARCLNLSDKLEDWIDTVIQGSTIEIDVGIINNEKYFLSSCAGGWFVDASYSTDNELKKNFGQLAYIYKALGDLANIKPFKVKVSTKELEIDEEIILFIILNGKHAGGFSNIIDTTDLSDGLMDIVIIKNCSHIDLAALFFQVLGTSGLNDKNVIRIQTKKCKIEGPEGMFLSVDGEKAMELPVSVRFLHKALKVYVRQ